MQIRRFPFQSKFWKVLASELLSDPCLSLGRQTSELGVTEHIEGDPCKFALWVGRTPTSDNKTVLKVRALRNRISFLCVQHRLSPAHPSLTPPHPSPAVQASSLELKQEWVRSIRQVIQERRGHLRGALREPIPLPKTPNPTLGRQRSISRRSAEYVNRGHVTLFVVLFTRFV